MCNVCKDGTPGSFSNRLIDITDQVYVGATDEYISVCRKHFLSIPSNGSDSLDK